MYRNIKAINEGKDLDWNRDGGRGGGVAHTYRKIIEHNISNTTQYMYMYNMYLCTPLEQPPSGSPSLPHTQTRQLVLMSLPLIFC